MKLKLPAHTITRPVRSAPCEIGAVFIAEGTRQHEKSIGGLDDTTYMLVKPWSWHE